MWAAASPDIVDVSRTAHERDVAKGFSALGRHGERQRARLTDGRAGSLVGGTRGWGGGAVGGEVGDGMGEVGGLDGLGEVVLNAGVEARRGGLSRAT
jgi:hypothetical protein